MSNNISPSGRETDAAETAGERRPRLQAVRGRSGWIISDGKAGNDAQTRGVFDALGLSYEVKRGRSERHLEAALAVGARQPGGALRYRRRASSARPGPTSPSPRAG